MRNRSARGSFKLSGRFVAKSAALAVLTTVIIGSLAATVSAITVYDRNAAVAYANANWNKVVSDGYFWINGSTANKYGAGTAVPVNVSGEASGIGDDCAHYVSSVLGSYPGSGAGGLTIPSRTNTYGEPGAAALDEMLVGYPSGRYGTTYKYGTLVSSVSQLTPGDVIGYDWDKTPNGTMDDIDHTVVYIGNNLVDCHATSHLGVNWNLGSATYYFIHITLPDSIVPTAPSNVSPTTNTSDPNLTPKLTANAFSDGAIGSTQIAAEWQIFNGTSLVYDSGADATDLRTLTVPAGKLTSGNTYNWKVRYEDNYNGWSSYSTPSTFSTIAPVYAGDFNHDGVIDMADYTVWRSGESPNPNSIGDYNSWRANFGTSPGGGASLLVNGQSVAVPEPSAMVCLSGLALLFARRSGRRAA